MEDILHGARTSSPCHRCHGLSMGIAQPPWGVDKRHPSHKVDIDTPAFSVIDWITPGEGQAGKNLPYQDTDRMSILQRGQRVSRGYFSVHSTGHCFAGEMLRHLLKIDSYATNTNMVLTRRELLFRIEDYL